MINEFINKSKVYRAKIFLPFLKFADNIGLTANKITFIRFWAGPIYVLLFPYKPLWAIMLIILANIADWFDGALARYQKMESDRGKFWDVLVDHINYVLPVFALLLVPGIDPIQIGYNLLIVPILYLLAILKESEHTKTDWIIHPYYTIIYFKPFAAIVLILFVLGYLSQPDEVFMGINIIMTIYAFYFAWILVKRWHYEQSSKKAKKK